MEKYQSAERRKYIRINTVFPVQMKILGPGNKEVSLDLIQGFTKDISKGGLRIEINNLDEKARQEITKSQNKLQLFVQVPFSKEPIKALSSYEWIKEEKRDYPNIYAIGISYENIDENSKNRLMRFAVGMLILPKFVAVVLFALLVLASLTMYDNLKQEKENALLVRQLVQASKAKTELESKLVDALKAKDQLQNKLRDNSLKISGLEESIKRADKEKLILLEKEKSLTATVKDKEELSKQAEALAKEKNDLVASLKNITQEKAALEKQLNQIIRGGEEIKTQLKKTEETKKGLEKKTAQNMYLWIKAHQNQKTGLVTSYEGDKNFEDWAFTYDQALAACSFMLFNDYDSAGKILYFLKNKAKKTNGIFVNAYDAATGAPVESTIHGGPNFWIAFAALQYTYKTGDKEYLSIATDMGDWALALQSQDPDGGIKGGPDVNWFSTEHNLEAYSMFKMLYQLTKQEKYKTGADKTLAWIKNNAYNKSEQRMQRGKGDSTIATDTFALAIAAIGPQTLSNLGMSPDQIIDFAENNTLVKTIFVRPDGGETAVSGFDFAKNRNLGRGGIISTEWTAQMIVGFKMMGRFYAAQNNTAMAKSYNDKANFYLNELDKLIISSPSRTGQGAGCLPYASHSNADTGHGWRTPSGKQTGSLSGTAYTLLAKFGYNPLSLTQD